MRKTLWKVPRFRVAGPRLNRRTRHGIGAGIGAAIVAYAASPYIALWNIDRAARTDNSHALGHYVDWSALTQSLKKEFVPAPAAGDDLPDFGSSFAGNVVSNAIESDLTPASLLTTAHQYMPAGYGAGQGGGVTSWTGLRARFVSLRKFEARIAEPGRTPFVVHMSFEHWGWKITRLEMPHDVARP